MDRTQMELLKIEDTSDFIKDEFSFLTLNDIRKALRNGSSGKYGRSYKLSTQEVCFWIREFIKENKSKQFKIIAICLGN
jgi:hypothetical protein